MTVSGFVWALGTQTHEYKHSREAFDAKARAMTRDHARPEQHKQDVGKGGGLPSGNDEPKVGSSRRRLPACVSLLSS